MNILFFGPQGSGKGTQGEKIAERYHIPLFGGGALLREEAKNDTERGRAVAAMLTTGALVTNDITNELIFDRLRRDDTVNGFMSDGYPRNKVQDDALRAFLPTLRGGTRITHVLVLELSDTEAVARLSGRRTCPACEEIYHIQNKPPKKNGVCDACGRKLVQRDDDTPVAIQKRLAIYRADTEPLLQRYERDGVVYRIDARGDMDEVFTRIIAALEK